MAILSGLSGLGVDNGTASSPAGRDFAVLNLITCGNPPEAYLRPSGGPSTTSPGVDRRVSFFLKTHICTVDPAKIQTCRRLQA